jgi:hypothetical protein
VNLQNIHLFSDSAKGKKPLHKVIDPKVTNAASLVRRHHSSAKILILTGQPNPLNNKAISQPLQEKFETMQKATLSKIKTPIHMDELMPFHKESMSRIKELLCERATQLANN